MVCTGNICRSPTMEAVARRRIQELGLDIRVDSAGTQGWHAGEPPDPRTIEIGEAAGFCLSDLRARRVRPGDLDDFDLVLAADRTHLEQLRRLRPGGGGARLALFLGEREVPDPYYGTAADFHQVLALVRRRMEAWRGDLAEF